MAGTAHSSEHLTLIQPALTRLPSIQESETEVWMGRKWWVESVGLSPPFSLLVFPHRQGS